MPLPTPHKGEQKDKFINRCMANDVMNNEYPDAEQRRAVCESQWDRKGKKSLPFFPQVYGKVWAILPERLEIMARQAVLADCSTNGIEAYRTKQATKFKNIEGRVAVLPLSGLITPKASILGILFGGTSLDYFGAAFDHAMANKDVGAIVLDIDSPGGSAYGVSEMANKIYAARGKKPIVAMVNSVADSAAYWIASAADEITITPSGEVGSIGVLAIHEDISAAAEKAGVKTTIVSSAKYKDEGNPFEPLGTEAKATIQARVDEIYEMMVTDIAQGRGVSAKTVKAGFGEGRVFGAAEAKERGMVDNIGTYEAVIGRLAQKPHRPYRAMHRQIDIIA